MDSFATVLLALQHGVPLRVLCEKFAHTRFEPSGWTGNEQIGYAKSLMDYIFRWLNLRFLSGAQLSLFAGLAPQQAPQLPASPTMLSNADLEDEGVMPHDQLSRLAEEVARKLNEVGQSPLPGMGTTASPAGGIAPELQASERNRRHRRSGDEGSRHLSRRRCDARHVRYGRRAELRSLRSHHGTQRKLLPVHELRVNVRLQLEK